MRLVFARDNDLTYNSIRFDISLQNFKKPLDIIWLQLNTQKKRSEEYLVTILAVKRKVWAIFLPRVHLEKYQTPGSRLKTLICQVLYKVYKLMLTWLMIFSDTLPSILVFVNENFRLCTPFTELFLFYWLLVVPLAILIAAPLVFSRT